MTVIISGDTGISPVTASGTSASVDGMTVGRGGGEVASNTAVGASALAANTSGATSVAVGYGSLGTATTGVDNVSIGYNSMNGNNGSYNIGIGRGALNGTGSATTYSTAVGYQALNSATGNNNTAIGAQALISNTTSSNNTAVGYQAMYSYQTGGDNVAVGTQAGYSINGNGNSTFVGRSAGYNSTGGNNTCLGYQAGYSNTTGAGGIFIGQGAGSTRATTGDFNILIGATAQNSATGGSYEIVIGTNNPTGKGSNTGYINAGGGGVYQGNNSAAWSVTSDQRLKKNIVDHTEGLDKILGIRVRNFEYRLPEEVTELDQSCAIEKTGVQLGVIAQELAEVLPDCVKTETTGVMSVNQDNITWHMINAIKDLKTIVDTQATEITALKAKVG